LFRRLFSIIIHNPATGLGKALVHLGKALVHKDNKEEKHKL
jgi:hypothetical protein